LQRFALCAYECIADTHTHTHTQRESMHHRSACWRVCLIVSRRETLPMERSRRARAMAIYFDVVISGAYDTLGVNGRSISLKRPTPHLHNLAVSSVWWWALLRAHLAPHRTALCTHARSLLGRPHPGAPHCEREQTTRRYTLSAERVCFSATRT
jgi:hypothetical protein